MTLASRILGFLAKLPPATPGAVSVERDLRATMADGVVLLADRWRPAGAQTDRAPVVLLRTPYGRRQWAGMIGRLFAERGYQVVIQSCRGTFGSGGTWVPFRNEKTDGLTTLAWIEGQPWFTGRLTTFGPSYLGLTQWAVAQEAPDYLKAMALGVTASNFRDAVVYPSESFALGTSLAWLQLLEYQERGWLWAILNQRRNQKALASGFDVLPLTAADEAVVGRHVPHFQDWLEHEVPGDSWWEPVDFGGRFEAVPPVSLVGGWYDIFLPSQLEDYQALRAADRSVRLTIGPWSHSSPGNIATSLRDGLEWFDGHLNQATSERPRNIVRLYVMGARRWVEFPTWPPVSDEQRWNLGGQGTLQRTPAGEGPPDTYRYDPAHPTPGIGGPSLIWNDAGTRDQKEREARPDVLTYTSEVLSHDLTVIGPLSTDLHVRTTHDHCDFFVRLCDVSPRGRSKNLSDGIVHQKSGSLTKAADGSHRIQIPMWPTAKRFLRGHRIRLQISSGAHPLFTRNTGHDEPLRSATRLRAADVEIFHDPTHPSFMTMPVLEL